MADEKLDIIPKRGKAKQTRTDRNLSTYGSEAFREACSKAGVQPSSRQASKWNNEYGAAYRSK